MTATTTNPTANPITCCNQINSGHWCQEWFETASRDAGLRARALRSAGYRVTVSGMGSQVTGLGVIKLTLVDIRPGVHSDTQYLPPVRVERI